MFDVVAIGELLIDFTPSGKGEMGNPVFEMNPGGAPANCLAALSSLGAKTAFIGKVGYDLFGDFLANALYHAGIDFRGLVKTTKAITTLAFVHLEENGERSFSFLRNPGADLLLTKEDINLSIIDQSSVLHFGSLSFTDNPAREAVLYALTYAKQKNKLISYDPNYRPLLWDDSDNAIHWMKKGFEYATIVKLSEDELELLTGQKDIVKGAQMLFDLGIEKIFVTMGNKGAYYLAAEENGFVPAFFVNAIDTTGCGDAFMGAMLYQIANKADISLCEQVLFANATAALCATKKGGIPAMPSKHLVNDLIQRQTMG